MIISNIYIYNKIWKEKATICYHGTMAHNGLFYFLVCAVFSEFFFEYCFSKLGEI